MATVTVVGVRETLRALNQFQPDVVKEVRKEINSAAGLIRTRARGFVPQEAPMSGWAVGASQQGRWAARAYDASVIKRGITTKRGTERKGRGVYAYEIKVSNDSAPGLIYEGAGTQHPTGEDRSHGNRGQRFVENIARTGLRVPLHRVLVRAGVEVGPDARDKYDKAVRKAQDALQRKVR